MKKFINPHEVPVIPGTEGWERMYPYYYRFIPKGVDSQMEEYENSQFWFIDNLHQTGVLLPFETIVDDAWWPSLNQISSRMVCFPTSRGLDHRMINGWVYLCSPEETDPDVIAAKAAVVGDRMNYYFQHWDELLPLWKKKQYDNAKELDSISFDKLPDIVSEEYIRKNLGYSPAHVMRTDYFKLLKVVDLCWEQHFELFNVGLAAYLSFSDLCKRLFPEITDKTIGMMVASGAAYDSYLPEAKLEELARLAIDLGVSNEIMKDGDADEVEARLAESEAGRKWQSERDKCRDPYFYVGTGYSVVTHKDKCWNDDWNIPLGILREYIGQILRGEFVKRDIDAKKRESDALVAQYRAVLDGQDKGMFDLLLPLARRGADHAESHMFWGETQYQPRQYNKLRQLGQLFCQYDMMEEPNDLFYFNRWEIPALIQDLTNAWATRTKPSASWQLKNELKWRKGVIQKFKEWDAPPFLGTPVEKVSDPFTIGLWGITTESVQNYLDGGEVNPEDLSELKGFQASPGVVEGRARVLSSHNDIDQIEKGEILVVTLTSPTWGPAFAKISACITDIGGMMSHAAIICREYGLPAVIGTGYATKAIKTGDLVRVDGDRGLITIVERNNA
ncbi:MAG: PEP-utilizing enzyme [Thermincola sp.]|nr:PEP-utilizing enzyme [Thermincola sp.]MDT3702829.1 PEP-utilizing enzyme [Thermincola sp.]